VLQKFLVLDTIPELRSEPIDPERNLPEIEVLLPIDVYLDAIEVIKSITFAQYTGLSVAKYWHKLSKLVYPYILFEKDRIWFIKNLG